MQLLDEGVEDIPVFRLFNGLAVRANDVDSPVKEALGQIHGSLAAKGYNDTQRLFQVDDVHHILGGQGFKIELVRGGVVGGHGFRVVVDDDGLIALGPDGPKGVDGGIVELHALANADGAGAQNDDLLSVRHHRLVFAAAIGGVEIGHIALKLAGAGIDHLVHRQDVFFHPQVIYRPLGGVPDPGDAGIGEAQALGLPQVVRGSHVLPQLLFKLGDVFQLAQKEDADGGGVTDPGRVHAPMQQLSQSVEPVGRALGRVIQQLRIRPAFKPGDADGILAVLQGPNRLLQALLPGSAHTHHFTGGLHLGRQVIGGRGELVKGEPGHFGDHIVQGRLKAGRGVGQPDLVQGHAHGDFGGDPGDGVAGGLGGQGRGPGHPGVDFNDKIPEGMGIQGELHIAAPLHVQSPDDLQGAVPEHMVFLVGQGLAGSHHDGVAGVDTYRVHILHVADGDGGIRPVPDDFVLHLVIALDALLYQHLVDGRQGKGRLHHFLQLGFVIGKSAAGAPQGEGRAQNDRVADLLGGLDGLRHGIGDLGRHHRLTDGLTELLEELPVLGFFDGVHAGAQQLNFALLQHPLFRQLDGKVQARLAADAGDNGIRPLVPADPGQILQG